MLFPHLLSLLDDSEGFQYPNLTLTLNKSRLHISCRRFILCRS